MRAIHPVVAASMAAAAIVGSGSARAQSPASPILAPPPAQHKVQVKTRVSDPEWREFLSYTLTDLPGFHPAAVPLDQWGGRTDRKVKATGFFHPEKIGDRWWLVDPEGGLFIHVGLSAIDPGKGPANKVALQTKFHTPENWAAETTGELRKLGFNGAGAWSQVDLVRRAPHPLVYTIIGDGKGGSGFMSGFGKKMRATRPGVGHTTYPNDCILVFHPDFAAYCDEIARSFVAYKDDPALLGYFSDNEMPVPRLDNYLKLAPDDPIVGSSYHAAKSWLDARKGKEAALSDITADDRSAWMEYVYDHYLSLTTGAIRKYDPNHLCLGPRLYSSEKSSPGALRVMGKYLDVIGINHYFVWRPKPADIARWTEWSGKPVMITEFYAKGMDSGFANTTGAGWTVPTQADRGLFYQSFTLGLLEAKNCVGWHWLKYMDNDPTDKNAEASNRDSNKGIVTNEYVFYGPLVDLMSSLNHAVYNVADYLDASPARTARPAVTTPSAQ